MTLTPFEQLALAAFNTSGQVVSTLTLNGNVVWTAGSLQENGTVALTAGSDGSVSEAWTLPSQSHAVKESAFLTGKACMFTDSKGVATEDTGANCLRSVAWFAPWAALNLLSSTGVLTVADVTQPGDAIAGITTLSYSRAVDALSDAQSQALAAQVAPRLAVKVAYDSKSALPQSVSFDQVLDSDPKHVLAYVIAFADYRSEHGLMVPHRIQRYVQGSLQADITITSVSVN